MFTHNGEAAHYFSDNFKINTIGINTLIVLPLAYHSLGGWKPSLLDDLDAYDLDGVMLM